MGQINTNNYPTVNSLADADLLIVENATNGTGTTTPKQLRENAIGTDTLQTTSQTVTGAINELKGEIDAGAGVVCYDVNTISSGYLGGQFSGSANLLLLHLTTDGTADASNGYMMMLSYTRPVARFAYGRLVDSDGVAYKQDVYADNTIICKISNSGEGTESDPEQVVILGIINAGFMLTPTAVVSDRDIQDGQGNTLSVLAEALTKTASGNPVVITDCAGGKARSLVTSIEPIQDLHGLPFPYVGGAYKNKLPLDIATIKRLNTSGTWNGNVYTVYGGTFTIQTDNDGNVTGVVANGTFTEKAFLIFVNSNDMTTDFAKTILGKTIILNGCPTRTGNPYAQMFNTWGTTSPIYDNGSDPATLAVPSTISGYRCHIEIYTGTVSNVLFKPMIRLSTESDATFAPYSNICPISGRTAVAVDDTGRNIWDEQWEVGMISSDNGQNVAANDTIRSKNYIPVIPSTNYYIRCLQGVVMLFYAGDKSYITYQNLNNGGAFTTPQNAKYIRFRTYVAYGTTYHNDICINISDASFNGQYVPYAHSSATIQLGQTVYGADINWDTGVMTVNTAKVDMGSLTYTAQGRSDDGIGYLYSAFPTGALANGECSSSAFAYTSYVTVAARWEALTTGHLSIIGNGRLMVCGTETTPEAFKTAVTGQDIEYKLATPTTIQLTPEQVQMLKGYNRVTIESGSIELGYIAKLT